MFLWSSNCHLGVWVCSWRVAVDEFPSNLHGLMWDVWTGADPQLGSSPTFHWKSFLLKYMQSSFCKGKSELLWCWSCSRARAGGFVLCQWAGLFAEVYLCPFVPSQTCLFNARRCSKTVWLWQASQEIPSSSCFGMQSCLPAFPAALPWLLPTLAKRALTGLICPAAPSFQNIVLVVAGQHSFFGKMFKEWTHILDLKYPHGEAEEE